MNLSLMFQMVRSMGLEPIRLVNTTPSKERVCQFRHDREIWCGQEDLNLQGVATTSA